MNDGLSGRGKIAVAFVEACHDALREQIDTANERFFNYRGRPNMELDAWVMSQPSRQRSYLRAVLDTARMHSMVMYSNGLDHALLLKDALDKPRNNIRIWSYLSLARGCLEAMMRITYLSSRGIEPRTIVLRSAAVVLDGLQEQMKLARHFDDVEDGDVLIRSQRALDAEVKRCERAGITLERGGKANSIQRVRRDDEVVNVVVDVTAESERRVPEVPAPYRIGSAAAHSGAWFLAEAVMSEEGYDPAADPDIMLTALSMVLFPLLVIVEVEAPPEDAAEIRGLRTRTRRAWSRALDIRDLAHPEARN